MEIAPHVSPKTIDAAQNGELINLATFLRTTDCYNDESEVYLTDGIIQSRAKRTKRTIDSCYTWHGQFMNKSSSRNTILCTLNFQNTVR